MLNVADYIPKDCIDYFAENKSNDKIVIPFLRDEEQRIIVEDMSEISHMLIAGTTGTGKTAFIQSVLTFMALVYKPRKAMFVIVDTKGNEYAEFNKMPQVDIPVITDLKKAGSLLSWVDAEIRNRLLEHQWETEIFVTIDDYASLAAGGYIDEELLGRILRLGRGVGVHVFLVTSIPTSKIISTALKLNIPYRIAFHVTSKAASRMILDDVGAENLYEMGSVIYKGKKYIAGKIIYLEESNISKIVEIMQEQFPRESSSSELNDNISAQNDDEIDEMLFEVGRWVIEKDRVSIAMIQRAFKIGFNRSLKIINQLEMMGVVGKENGTKPRPVLVNVQEFENIVNQWKNQAVVPDSQNLSTKATDELSRGATQAFQYATTKSALAKLRAMAIKAFSAVVNEEKVKNEIRFTPRNKIKGKDAELEICNDCIEITKRLNLTQTATYRFAPELIKRVRYHVPMLIMSGYVSFDVDSSDWNITNDLKTDKVVKKLPEQVFTVKFDKTKEKEFESYARQIALETGVEFAIE